MDYEKMIKSGEIEYSPFEEKLLLATNPSKFKQAPSDLEELVKFRNMFVKFDFSILNPLPNINIYLSSIKNKLSSYFNVSSLSVKNVSDGYLIREALIKKIDELTEIHTPDKIFVKTRKDELNNFYDKVQNKTDFKKSLRKINKIFPESSVFLYGSSISKESIPNDFDFRILIPEMTKKDYIKYINHAKKLSKFPIPITFGLNRLSQFTNFQLSDDREMFSGEKSVLVQGEVSIYNSKLKEKLKLISVGQILSKTRKSLIKEHYYKIPILVKARSNEPIHINSLLSEVFEDKGFKFEKFSEENLSRQQIEKRLINANINLSNLLLSYKEEICEELNI